MQTVTRYVAEDGSEWRSAAQAQGRDQTIRQVESIMAALPPQPQKAHLSFSNGHGYVQHDRETVLSVRGALLDLAAQQNSHSADTLQKLKDPAYTLDWALRVLDGFNDPVEKGIRRLACIDSESREWGQMYFALHPDEGDQVRLNP